MWDSLKKIFIIEKTKTQCFSRIYRDFLYKDNKVEHMEQNKTEKMTMYMLVLDADLVYTDGRGQVLTALVSFFS